MTIFYSTKHSFSVSIRKARNSLKGFDPCGPQIKEEGQWAGLGKRDLGWTGNGKSSTEDR